jgi:pimeloyl-ACP methyl ester carboxylesterase
MRTGILRMLFFIVFMPLFTGNSQPVLQSIQKNQVIDTIRCTEQPKQSYALYLPSQYDPSKQWPVIMIFDPSARGKTAVEIFREAGSRYGYILACSNNSRNGPVSVNLTAAWAVLQDLDKRFKIDQKRIFIAGFSGGSRFAMALAASEKIIAGVIGCGAGLPNDQVMNPGGSSDFLYYGLAGTRDMNYLEMHELITFFQNQTKVISFIRTFEGGHQWPDAALITDAVEWITFQSMKRNLIPADNFLTEDIRSKTKALINSSQNAGDVAGAVQYMRFAARDFEGTPFAAEMSKLLSDSEGSDEYRGAIRDWNRMASNEQGRREKYFNYLSELIYSGAFPDSASAWWNRETSSLVRLREKGNATNSRMASRVLNFVSILCSEQGNSFYRNKAFLQASIMFQVCTISDSDNPMNYYNLAKSYAANGKTKESIDALSLGVTHGFKSVKAVEADPVFEKIIADQRYKALLIKIK